MLKITYHSIPNNNSSPISFLPISILIPSHSFSAIIRVSSLSALRNGHNISSRSAWYAKPAAIDEESAAAAQKEVRRAMLSSCHERLVREGEWHKTCTVYIPLSVAEPKAKAAAAAYPSFSSTSVSSSRFDTKSFSSSTSHHNKAHNYQLQQPQQHFQQYLNNNSKQSTPVSTGDRAGQDYPSPPSIGDGKIILYRPIFPSQPMSSLNYQVPTL
jgi:hypothetical protein